MADALSLFEKSFQRENPIGCNARSTTDPAAQINRPQRVDYLKMSLSSASWPASA
jgi:hypothetical protein